MTIRENREIYNIKKSENEIKKNNVYIEISLLPSSHADVFLAGKPSNTFSMAFEKVLEGLVKNGVFASKRQTFEKIIFTKFVNFEILAYLCTRDMRTLDFHYRLEFKIRQEGSKPVVTICTVTDITNHYQ